MLDNIIHAEIYDIDKVDDKIYKCIKDNMITLRIYLIYQINSSFDKCIIKISVRHDHISNFIIIYIITFTLKTLL